MGAHNDSESDKNLGLKILMGKNSQCFFMNKTELRKLVKNLYNESGKANEAQEFWNILSKDGQKVEITARDLRRGLNQWLNGGKHERIQIDVDDEEAKEMIKFMNNDQDTESVNMEACMRGFIKLQ